MNRLLMLALLWLGGVAGAVPVSLHVLLDRSGGVGLAARLSVGDRTYDVNDDGLILDLPAGQYPVRLLTAGGRLVPDEGSDQTTLTVLAPVTEKELIVEPGFPLKLTLPQKVVAGEPFVAQLDVQNTYGLPLTLTPLLRLPEGVLALGDTRRVLTLQSGETGSLQVRLVAAQAGTLQLDGVLNETSGLSQATAVAEAPATPAQPALQLPVSADARLDADPTDPLPGEVVTFQLKLRNPGSSPVTVRATPTLPDWIVPEEGAQPQTLSLPASGEASLTFSGRVAFGPAQADAVSVRLDGWSAAGTAPLAPQVRVQRQLLSVQVAQPDEGTVGERATVVALVRNPTARPQQVTLRGSGAGVMLEPVNLSLDARSSATGELGLTPGQSGRQVFMVSALTALPDGSLVPVSLPASNEVRAAEPVQEQRVAVISQPFSLRGVPGLDDPASAVTLLAAQDLPEGAAYQSGSSQLNGKAIADPQVGNSGRLYWTLGRPPLDGVLSYRVASSDETPTLAPLALTASVGGKDLYLSGEVPSSEVDTAAAAPTAEGGGLIRLPRQGTVLRGQDKTGVVLEGPAGVPASLFVNGQEVPGTLLGEETVTLGRRRLSYAGVALQPGANVIEARYGDLSDRLEVNVAGAPVRLSVDAGGAVADGASPVVVKILALDARGLSSGDGTITVGTDLEPITPDADPSEAGYQVVMRDGVATLRLQPLTSARRLRVSAVLGRLTTSQEVFVDVQLRTRYVYQASFGVRFGGGGVNVDAAARGYAELPVLGGQLQVAADSDGLPRFLGGNGITGTQTSADLGRFPITGSGTEARGALASDLGIAFRYERRELSLGYYAAGVTLAPLTPLPSFSALRAEVREIGGSPFSARGFVGQLPSGGRTETFIPDGRRSYVLSELPRIGSTVVTVVAGGLSRPLIAGRDYLIDDGTGTVVLAAPLSRYNENFVPQTLTVLYLPLSSTSTVLTYGGSVSYASGPWSVDVAAVQLRGAAPIDTGVSDFSLAYGVQVAYRTPALQAALNYGVTSFDPGGKFGLMGTYLAPDGNVAGSVDLSRSNLTGLVGTAEVSARVSGFRVRLSHLSLGVAPATVSTPALTSQRTTLTLERAVRPGLTLGGGLEYAWTPDTALLDGGAGLSGVVLGRFEQGNSSVELQHAQPFSAAGGIFAQTRLTGSLALTPTTFLEGRVVRVWDDLGTLSGEIGVRQTLGNVNYTVSYQLPGVSGESSRARFGVAAPLPITDRLSANINANVLRDLSNGIYSASGALGFRYRTDTFTATASVEGGRDFGATDTGSRLTLRGGATGTVGGQDLSLDAAYTLLPTPGGQFTFSYARRTDALATLAYARLNTGTGVGSVNPDGGTLLEGELQLIWQPWRDRTDLSPALIGLELQPGVAFRLPLQTLPNLAVQVGLGVSVPITPQVALAATGYFFYQPLTPDDTSTSSLSAAYALDLKYTVSPGLRLVAGYTVSQVSALTPDARPGFHIRAELYGGRP